MVTISIELIKQGYLLYSEAISIRYFCDIAMHKQTDRHENGKIGCAWLEKKDSLEVRARS